MAGSASSQGKRLQVHHLIPKGHGGNFGHISRPGVSWQCESAVPNSRHKSSTKNACRSPTLLTEANAVRSAVFNDRNLSSTDCRGSKGSSLKAVRTEGRSQEGTRWGRGGFNPRRPSEEPDVPSRASHRRTVYCIVMCGNSSNIHF